MLRWSLSPISAQDVWVNLAILIVSIQTVVFSQPFTSYKRLGLFDLFPFIIRALGDRRRQPTHVITSKWENPDFFLYPESDPARSQN